MTKKSAETSSTVLQEPESRCSATWVVEMRRHFEANGYYRAVDLERLLGDPRDHSEVTPLADPAANFFHR